MKLHSSEAQKRMPQRHCKVKLRRAAKCWRASQAESIGDESAEESQAVQIYGQCKDAGGRWDRPEWEKWKNANIPGTNSARQHRDGFAQCRGELNQDWGPMKWAHCAVAWANWSGKSPRHLLATLPLIYLVSFSRCNLLTSSLDCQFTSSCCIRPGCSRHFSWKFNLPSKRSVCSIKHKNLFNGEWQINY